MCTRTESGLDHKRRRSIRLKGYDYSQPGAYFVTICTRDRAVLLDNPRAISIIQKWWDALPKRFPGARTDEFVVMPNHIHGIIFLESLGADAALRSNRAQSARIATINSGVTSQLRPQKPALPKIVQWFKTMSTNEYIKGVSERKFEPFSRSLWQRNYYEHIIRDEADLESVRQYVMENPNRWEEDEDNPKNQASHSG